MKWILIAAALGSLCADTAFPDESGGTDDVGVLIRRLDDDAYVTREEATKKLVQIGRPALPHLEATIEKGTPEARVRARNARLAIFDRIAWEAPSLDIEGKGRTLNEVLQDISSKERLDIRIGDVAGVYPPPARKLFDTDFHGPLWSILDELAERTGAQVFRRGAFGYVSLCVVKRFENRRPATYLDGVKFEQEGPVRFDWDRNRIIVGIDCYGDSARNLVGGTTIANVLEAVTDSGEKLYPSLEGIESRFATSGQILLYHHNTTAFLSMPQRQCRAIRRLECEIEIECLGIPETITFVDLEKERPTASSDHFEGEMLGYVVNEQGVRAARVKFSRGYDAFAYVTATTLRRDRSTWQSSVVNEVDIGNDGKSFGILSSFVSPILQKPESLTVNFYRHITTKRFRVTLEHIPLGE